MDNGLLNDKLNNHFAGKIVRKDLTKKIKEGANVPVYVLEYLLGMYCATTEEAFIEQGVQNVKKILADNFVRPDEAQKIISKLREQGSYTVIDKVSVKLNYRDDIYEAEFSNLGIKNIPISEKYPSEFERLLCGGIWCIVQLEYFYDVLQVCLDSGAKKVLLPITSTVDMATVPPELMGKFNLIFYQSPEDAVFKALGVE